MPDGEEATEKLFNNFDTLLNRGRQFINLKQREKLSPFLQLLLLRCLLRPKTVALAAHFHSRVSISVNRRFMRTQSKLLGLAHGASQIGDRVVLVKGSAVPLIIRAAGDDWQLVGGCYVHGIMQGKAFEEEKCREIVIV
ncbi:MAG: hypothetical protein M1813_000897 [Trichoglossum hirsutum]|nr:MAG: hypothetical protein M1813_000897 [Trichoglossum hirsutum]